MTQEEKNIIVNEVLDRIKDHKHTGLDSLKIDPRDLEGFKIYASAPTHDAENGTMCLFFDGTNYKFYARINNAWKSATLS